MVLIIISYRSELFLFLAIDVTGFKEDGFDLLRYIYFVTLSTARKMGSIVGASPTA